MVSGMKAACRCELQPVVFAVGAIYAVVLIGVYQRAETLFTLTTQSTIPVKPSTHQVIKL